MKLVQLFTRWISRGGSSPTPRQVPSSKVAERQSKASLSNVSSPPSRRIEIQRDSGWIAPGSSVKIKGFDVPGGMLYVGSSLGGPGSSQATPDPALINPTLHVDFRHPDRAGQQMGYWPSYSQITPSCRAAYLEWLAAGRPADAYIGYVFLFFYGLERRMLVDVPHSEEAKSSIPYIVAEVRRLLDLYGENNSFRSYASNFLSAIEVVQGIADPAQLTPPKSTTGWDFPMDLKLALGTFVRRGQPIPKEWALAWLKTHPDIHFRTPATRCPAEFQDLFYRRYEAKFGEGLRIRPNKTRLKLVYRPASAAFRGSFGFDVGDLPDVTRLSAPVKQLVAIADRVTDELDAYSRWVGRHGATPSLLALALLPLDLANDQTEVEDFVSWVDQQLNGADLASVPVANLWSRWAPDTPATMTKRNIEILSRFLEGRGYGMEPDIRFGGINLAKTSSATLFRLPTSSPSEVTESYKAAIALVRLGAAIALADGQVSTDEQFYLEKYVLDTQRLSDTEQARLHAHLHWTLGAPADLAGLKDRCAVLNDGQKSRFGQFLVGLAGADGRIQPEELKTLAKTYRLLGLNPDNIAHDVHALATAASGPATEPVMIIPAESGKKVYTLPTTEPKEPVTTITLSTDRVAAILAETNIVTSVLGAVFSDADPEPALPDDDVEIDSHPVGAIPGLDEPHTILVRHLAGRPLWPRYEIEELTDRLGLMTAGAIENINDAAFEIAGEPFLEGHDPMEVNAQVFLEFANV